MDYVWSDTRWASREARETLVRCLEIRRSGPRTGLTEDDLHRAFGRVCGEALAQRRPPEAVLEVFRMAWDHWFSRRHGDDPRDLRYYGTLAQCLDVYLERVSPVRPRTTRKGGCGAGT